MTDAISRSAVLKEIDWAIDLAMDDEMHHAMCTLGERFKELPALDAVPVVHAKWIEAAPGKHIGMKCSYCKARIKYSEYNSGNHNFCHKCGAFMGGDQRE